MSLPFEDCCPQATAKLDPVASEAGAASCLDHLYAFNLGRMVGRMENDRDARCLRVRWLLWGAAVGVTLAAVFLQFFLIERILPLVK